MAGRVPASNYITKCGSVSTRVYICCPLINLQLCIFYLTHSHRERLYQALVILTLHGAKREIRESKGQAYVAVTCAAGECIFRVQETAFIDCGTLSSSNFLRFLLYVTFCTRLITQLNLVYTIPLWLHSFSKFDDTLLD